MKDFTLNKVMLAGVVSIPPKTTTVSSDHTITWFELTTLSVRGKKEIYCNHRVFLYGKSGLKVEAVVKLGDPVYVEGEMMYRDVAYKDGSVSKQASVNAMHVRVLPYAVSSREAYDIVSVHRDDR